MEGLVLEDMVRKYHVGLLEIEIILKMLKLKMRLSSYIGLPKWTKAIEPTHLFAKPKISGLDLKNLDRLNRLIHSMNRLNCRLNKPNRQVNELARLLAFFFFKKKGGQGSMDKGKKVS